MRNILLSFCFVLSTVQSIHSQKYEEFCSSLFSTPILDYLHQDSTLYVVRSQSGFGSHYSISTIDSLGTEFIFDYPLGAGGARFFETSPSEWELVVADLVDTDFPVSQIALTKKNPLGEITQTIYEQIHQGSSVNSEVRFIKAIDYHFGSYYVLGSNSGARLDNLDLTYFPDFQRADGVTSRINNFNGLYSWQDSILSRGTGGELFRFDTDIKDIAFDDDHNYVMLEDKIIVLDTLMENIQDTISLRQNAGDVIQLKVDNCCFYVLEDSNLDKVVRYSKTDTEVFGFLYQESSPKYKIENFRIDSDYLIAKVSIEGFQISFLHKQEKRILRELNKRPQLDFEIIEHSLSLDPSGSVDALTGPITFAVRNIGNIPTQKTGIYLTYAATGFKLKSHSIVIDTLLNPGETLIINDTLNLIDYGRDDIRFRMQAADNNPFLTPLDIINLPIQLSSTNSVDEFFQLYPNPLATGQELQYELPFESGQLKILNNLGNIVYTSTLTSKNGSIKLPKLNEGLYYCILRNHLGRTSSTKLIIGL